MSIIQSRAELNFSPVHVHQTRLFVHNWPFRLQNTHTHTQTQKKQKKLSRMRRKKKETKKKEQLLVGQRD
jgi:hypothetical protein